MAIDTEDKRRSVIAVLPVPNADIDQGDRQQVAWLYRGVLARRPMNVDPLFPRTGLAGDDFFERTGQDAELYERRGTDFNHLHRRAE